MEILIYIAIAVVAYHFGVVSGYGTGFRVASAETRSKVLNVVFEQPTKDGEDYLFFDLETDEFLAQHIDYKEGINKIASELEEGQIIIAVQRDAKTYATV